MSRSQASASSDDSPAEVASASVSQEEVEHLADLARLDFTANEKEALAEDLSRLLGHAQQLGEVDTAGVEPMPAGAPAVPKRLRPDQPEKPLSQKEALENAPDVDDGFFRMPGALEE